MRTGVAGVSGVLLLDKPTGISSNAALQRARRLYDGAKGGHAGTLDPLATGLLVICLGEATKFSSFQLDAAKEYRARLRLGVTTTTGDSEGEAVAVYPVAVSRERVLEVLCRFVGRIRQTPPLYSALKRDGRPLYEYARAGLEVAREAREVSIYRLELLAFEQDSLEVYVACSKGTYIRSLAEDIGRALGCGAYLSALRRTRSGGFAVEQAITLEALQDMSASERARLLLAPQVLLAALPRVDLDTQAALDLQCGRDVRGKLPVAGDLVCLYAPDERFLGVGEGSADGALRAKRLMATDGLGVALGARPAR